MAWEMKLYRAVKELERLQPPRQDAEGAMGKINVDIQKLKPVWDRAREAQRRLPGHGRKLLRHL
jgi:hypothetical protein